MRDCSKENSLAVFWFKLLTALFVFEKSVKFNLATLVLLFIVENCNRNKANTELITKEEMFALTLTGPL